MQRDVSGFGMARILFGFTVNYFRPGDPRAPDRAGVMSAAAGSDKLRLNVVWVDDIL